MDECISNKSILVIDTPENCYYCELNNYHFCNVTGNNIKEYLATEYRPKWCPLSPLPQRVTIPEVSRGDSKSLTHTVQTMYGIGYNKCLSDIINKNKGEN